MKPTPQQSKKQLDDMIQEKMKSTGLSKLKVLKILSKGLKKMNGNLKKKSE